MCLLYFSLYIYIYIYIHASNCSLFGFFTDDCLAKHSHENGMSRLAGPRSAQWAEPSRNIELIQNYHNVDGSWLCRIRKRYFASKYHIGKKSRGIGLARVSQNGYAIQDPRFNLGSFVSSYTSSSTMSCAGDVDKNRCYTYHPRNDTFKTSCDAQTGPRSNKWDTG